MVWSHLEPKTECLPECHLECHLERHPEHHPEHHPKHHPECHPECQDQLDMVRSGGWQTKFNVNSRLRSQSQSHKVRAWESLSLTNILWLVNNSSLYQKLSLAKMRSFFSIICNMYRKDFQSLRTSVTKKLLKCVHFHSSNCHVVARGWALWLNNNRYYFKV